MNKRTALRETRPVRLAVVAERARADVGRLARSALDRLHDIAFLETHPLAAAQRAESGDAGSAGRALRRRLVEAIDALGDPRSAEAGRLHQLLVRRYVEGLAPAAVWRQLGLSRSVYYEEQARAVAAVAAILGRQRSASAVPVPGLAATPRPIEMAPLETTFVGRDADLADLTRLIAQGRLVTVAGPAGTGKTRLTAELVRRWPAAGAASVAVVHLAPLTTAEQVLPAVAQAVGARETPGAPLLESIAAHLRTAETLLVLDNVEHLLDAAPQIGELLARAPGLRVVATSREPLTVPGEQELALEPLSAPPAGARLSPDQALTYPAVRLFVDRARAVDARFALDDDDVAAVAGICRRCDGLPLAIELAAARVRTFPPRALLARLQRSLDLLAGGRGAEARHRTLRAALDWSYQLLDTSEQRLFRVLGTLAGGGRLDALAALVAGVDRAGSEEGGLWQTAESLLRRSLLGRIEDPDGEPRFVLLETMRQYALEQLAANGEVAEARARHAAHYWGLAVQAAAELAGPGQTAWVERLARENENLRVALTWLVDDGDGPAATQMATALALYWEHRGQYREGREWLLRALALPGTEAGRTRTAAFDRAAMLATRQDDYAAARGLWEQSLAIARATGDRFMIARSLKGLAAVGMMVGDPTGARRSIDEALAVAREVGDALLEAEVFMVLGTVTLRAGDYAESRAASEAGLRLHRQLDDAFEKAQALRVLSIACRALGDYDAAQRSGEQSLALWRDIGSPYGTSLALRALALIALDRDDRAAAVASIREGLTISLRAGLPRSVARHLDEAARLAAAARHPEAAMRLLGAAETILSAIHSPRASHELVDLERTLALVRPAGAGESFEVARVEGQAMSMDGAVELAMELLDLVEASTR